VKKLMLLSAFFLVFMLVACGGGDEGANYPVSYFNAEVISSSESGNAVTLTIESEGFYPMVVEVTIASGQMTAFDVIEHRESGNWGGALISDGDFIAAIIQNANNLSNVDVEAGVTATAEALIDVARAAMEHYKTYYE